MRSFMRSISSTGACSPSSQPSDRATAALVVASARQPGMAASAFALATSHAFGRTRICGSRCSRRSMAALALWSMQRGYWKPCSWPLEPACRQPAELEPVGDQVDGDDLALNDGETDDRQRVIRRADDH